MRTILERSALRLAAALTLCIPVTACDSGPVGRGCPAPLTWSRIPGSPAGTAIAGSAPDDVWLLGTQDGANVFTHIDSVHGGPLAGGAPGDWWYQGSFFGTPEGGQCPFTPTPPCDSFGNGFGHHAPVGGYDAFIELSALGCANCTVNAAWASSVDDLWFVGDHLFHFDGSKWRVGPSPTTAMLRSIWGTSGSDIWAVGDGGTIVHFDGETWSVVASPTTQNLAGVWASGPCDVWAIGDAVYHATR